MLQVIVYGVGCGMSGSWWRIQHNKHHAMPQKLGHDVDLNTLPLVAFTEKVVKRCGVAQKTWLRMQSFLFPTVTALLVALGWQYYLHIRHILRAKQWSELASIIARHVIWTAVVTRHFGLYQSTLLFLAYDWLASNYIFINFAVSHTHLDVVEKEDRTVRPCVCVTKYCRTSLAFAPRSGANRGNCIVGCFFLADFVVLLYVLLT
jgi:fatty acid desaturase 2 (delta-6 desaturase)